MRFCTEPLQRETAVFPLPSRAARLSLRPAPFFPTAAPRVFACFHRSCSFLRPVLPLRTGFLSSARGVLPRGAGERGFGAEGNAAGSPPFSRLYAGFPAPCGAFPSQFRATLFPRFFTVFRFSGVFLLNTFPLLLCVSPELPLLRPFPGEGGFGRYA